MKGVGLFMLLAGVANVALGAVQTVPEIDASTATGAIALVCGGVLILRSRLRK